MAVSAGGPIGKHTHAFSHSTRQCVHCGISRDAHYSPPAALNPAVPALTLEQAGFVTAVTVNREDLIWLLTELDLTGDLPVTHEVARIAAAAGIDLAAEAEGA